MIRPTGVAAPRRAPTAPPRARRWGCRRTPSSRLLLGSDLALEGPGRAGRALAEPALRDAGAIGLIAGRAWPGEERHEQALRELAAELGLGDRLRLLGFRDDLDRLYGAADAVVVPSTQPDPLPNSALEAAAAGCCVVAAAHGGLPEIVRDGVNGRLVPPGDPRRSPPRSPSWRATRRSASGSARPPRATSRGASPPSACSSARRRSTTSCSPRRTR